MRILDRLGRGTAGPRAAGIADPAARHVAYAVAARLLQYPDPALDTDILLIARAVAGLPAPVRDPLARAAEWSTREPLLARQEAYVATFDMKRRCCLYLTYYLNGDTRRRGMALLRFKQAYASCGLRLESGELPDFLPMVLEFAATGDEDLALALLEEHREGLEVLRTALDGLASPWADVMWAVLVALPPLTGARRQAALALVADGPPTEMVGLDPFPLLPTDPGARA